MALYYFEVIGGLGTTPATEGIPFENLEAAIDEARRAAGDIIRDEIAKEQFVSFLIVITSDKGERAVVRADCRVAIEPSA